MFDMIFTIVFQILPWVVGLYVLFPKAFNNIFNNIFARVKEVNHRNHVVSEIKRRDALLAEMKRLGYDRDAATFDDLDHMHELFVEEFPDLYKDKE